MPIRIPRVTFPQEPGVSPSSAQRVVPVQALSNPVVPGAQAASEFARLTAQIYAEDRDREIETRVLELDIERRKSDQQVLNTYGSLRGVQAVDGRQKAMEALSSNSKRIRESIKDPAVANAWRKQDAALTLAGQDELDHHYRKERTRWQVDTHEARAELLVGRMPQLAFAEGYDARTGELSNEARRTRDAYLNTIDEMGTILGWSEEQKEQARRTADQTAYGDLTEVLVRQERYDEAMAVMGKHGDRIEPKRREYLGALSRSGMAELRDRQEREGMRTRAAQRALQLLYEARTFKLERTPAVPAYSEIGPDGEPITHEEVPADAVNVPLAPVLYAQAQLNPELMAGKLSAQERDMTLEYVQKQATDDEKRRDAADKELVTEAEAFLDANKLSVLEEAPRLYEAVRRRGLLPQLREFERSGRYRTIASVYVEARGLTDAELRSKPWDHWFLRYRGGLANHELSVIEAMHKNAVGETDLASEYKLKAQNKLEALARNLGIIPKDAGDRRGRDAAQPAFEALQTRVYNTLRLWPEAHNGKMPEEADIDAIFDSMQRDKVEKTTGSFTSGLGLSSGLEEKFVATLPEDDKSWSILVNTPEGPRRIYRNSIEQSEFDASRAEVMEAARKRAAAGDRNFEHYVPTMRDIVETWVENGMKNNTRRRFQVPYGWPFVSDQTMQREFERSRGLR